MDTQRDLHDAQRAVKCPCGKVLRVDAKLLGKQVRCPACQKVFVPATDAPLAAVQSLSQTDPTQALGGPAAESPSLVNFLAPAQAADELGRLGGYRVLKILGHGGMGVVYKAEDPALKRFVALKVILPAVAMSASIKERFLREAQAAAALKHDHIVTIHQVGEDRRTPFLAMEYLEGESLEERLKRLGRLPLAEVVRIGNELAQGLAAAHQRGLIHRDIKPANIWLEAPRGRAKILDFGLARSDSLAAAEAGQLTQSGMIVGTPAYMPPEQAKGESVDHRCDLYSLGVVLYRACTGELPIKGDNPIALLSNLALVTPTEPCDLNRDIPPDLNDLIVRLLAKEREDRPADAQEVADVLQAVAVDVPEMGIRAGTPRSPHRPAGKKSPSIPDRRRGGFWILAGVCATLVASLVVGYFLMTRPQGGAVEPVDNPQAKGPPKEKVAGQSAYDRLDRKNIPPMELKIAGNGDPANAAPELVAILGDSRFQHPHTQDRASVFFDHIAVTPDGKSIASVRNERAVRIWDAATGELLQVIPFAAYSGQIVFSPEGTLYATQPPSDILAWDPRTGKNRRVPFQHHGAKGISFSRDGATVLTSGHGNGLHHVSRAADGRLILTVSADPNTLGVLSPDAGLVAFVKDKTLRLWNVAQNKDDGVIADLNMPPDSLQFTPDGRTLLVRFIHSLAVYDVKQRKITDQLKRGVLYSHSLSPDGQFVATSGWGATIEIWKLAEGEIHAKMQGESGGYVRLAFFPDGKRLASQDYDNRVHVWDLAGKQASPPGEFNCLSHVRATPEGVITVGARGTFREWDLATRKSRVLLNSTGAGPPEVSSDGKTIAFANGTQPAQVFDRETGKSVSLDSARFPVCISASPDGRRIAAGGDDEVTVWDMPAGGKKVLPLSASSLALTDEGRLVVARHPKLVVHDLATEKLLWAHENRFPLDLRASRDGTLLAMTQSSGGPALPTLLLELATGKTLHELPAAERLALSPDGRKLATLTTDGVSIWNTQTGNREHQIGFGLDKSRIDLDFAPDGRHLVVANGNGVICIFRLRNP